MLLFAAILSAALSGEIAISPDRSGPAAGAQYAPEFATSPHGMLVVWRDERAYRVHEDVYAARVDNEGRLLDPHGFLVPSSGFVTWTGRHYLIVGQDIDGVYATRIPLSGPPGACRLLARVRGLVGVATTETSTLLVSNDGIATLVDASGTRTIRLDGFLAGRVRVVDGRYTFVITGDSTKLVRISVDGNVESLPVLGVPPSLRVSASITPEGEVLLLLGRWTASFLGLVEAARVDPITGEMGSLFTLEEASYRLPETLDAAWDGTSHLVCWNGETAVHVRRVAVRSSCGPRLTTGADCGVRSSRRTVCCTRRRSSPATRRRGRSMPRPTASSSRTSTRGGACSSTASTRQGDG